MSADNGIYVLETDGPEFRVKEMTAVENLYWSRERSGDSYATPEEALQNAREAYGQCPVFMSRAFALEYAAGILESLDICEYGISLIKMKGKF